MTSAATRRGDLRGGPGVPAPPRAGRGAARRGRRRTGARDSLRKAAARLPRDVAALGLLGQACYRAGLYEEAAEAYGKLVDDNPAEVSGRVNLGLAWLKGGRRPEAVRQFSIALDLDPDHRKSMGYLGLALLESGDPRAARPWLEKSGSATAPGPLRRAPGRAGRPGRRLRRSRHGPGSVPRCIPRRPAPVRRWPRAVVRPSPTPAPLRSPVAPGGLGRLRRGAHRPARRRRCSRSTRESSTSRCAASWCAGSTGSSRCAAR